MCRHGQTTVENDTKSTRWVDYWHSWRQHWHGMNPDSVNLILWTKPDHQGSLDIVVIPVVFVGSFSEYFLVSAQRPSEDGVWIFAPQKWTFWATKILGGTDFRVVPPLLNNTAKTSFGEDLVKICPAIAEQSRQKKKTQNAVAY